METKQLLEAVVKDRLEKAASETLNQEEREAAFKEAMAATDRLTELEKVEMDKSVLPVWVKYVEIIGVPILLGAVDYGFKKGFAKYICNFEKDYTFTTQAGRSLSQFFKFKK